MTKSMPPQAPLPQPAVTPTHATSSYARNEALRVRQHVNPLAAYFQRPLALDDSWLDAAFDDADRPLVIDVGVAKGRWVHALAMREREKEGAVRGMEGCNYLGLEIRSGLVSAANAVRDRDGLGNLHYLYANANVSFGDIVAGMSDRGGVRMVAFQFCDPWFKARHAKRRMVQAPLVEEVRDVLRSSGGGQCFIVSDVKELAEEMREKFGDADGFDRDEGLEWDEEGWLKENPFGVQTEREVAVLKKNLHVYRAMYCVSG